MMDVKATYLSCRSSQADMFQLYFNFILFQIYFNFISVLFLLSESVLEKKSENASNFSKHPKRRYDCPVEVFKFNLRLRHILCDFGLFKLYIC